VTTTLLATLFAFSASAQTGQQSAKKQESAKREAEDAAGFKEFTDRVQEYVKLHKSAASSLPALKPTPEPEILAQHQKALAAKIAQARPNAKRGDIFTEKAREAFRHAVRAEFQGPHGHGARTTIRQGEPLKQVHLQINQAYPDGVPFTTVPPTLLLKFPKLPDQVAYRIVVHDLILLDVDANMVIDRIPEIIPNNF
jgi:hypothetical protein